MAQAYTPGLKITENTTIKKERRLPLMGDVLVKQGDKVKAHDVVARTFLPGDITLMNMANRLGCDPGALPEMMLKKEGDKVEEGELIAQSKGIFGLFKSTAAAPVSGTIENISRITGQLQFRGKPQPISIDAYIDGEVIDVHEGEGVTVRTSGAFIQGILGIGGEAFGEIKIVVNDPSEELTEAMLTPECKGKIVVGGSYVRHDVLKKAVQAGVSGLIVGGMDAEDMKDFMGYDLGVAITGQEKLGITIMLSEGYGKISMARATFDLLKKNQGKVASMNGATQIRAGVMRPEIIIPATGKAAGAGESGDAGESATEMKIGTPLRVIRVPYFGRIGKVAALPPELQKMESETMVRVVELEFENGEKAVVPRANVEVLEM